MSLNSSLNQNAQQTGRYPKEWLHDYLQENVRSPIHNTSLNRTEAKAGFKFPGLTHRKSRKILARQFRRRWNDTLACFSY